LQTPPLAFTDLSGLGDPTSLKYRSVIMRGQYDHSQEIALNNQNWRGQPGVHLITPLIIEGSDRAVMVDRGWIPYAESTPEKWSKFAEPGPVEVKGWILLTDPTPGSAQVGNAPERSLSWFRVDIDRIQAQVSHPLLHVYIQQSPTPSRTGLPYRSELNPDLSEGPHLGYAIFWFSFAAMLGVGYGRFVQQKSAPVSQMPRLGAGAECHSPL
jgi:surfeit locus 1 family protein